MQERPILEKDVFKEKEKASHTFWGFPIQISNLAEHSITLEMHTRKNLDLNFIKFELFESIGYYSLAFLKMNAD